MTKVLSCEYVSYLSSNVNIFISYFNVCMNMNEEQNKEATIKCLQNLKTCTTKVNTVITYFISALDYLSNLTDMDLETFVNDYTTILKEFKNFEKFLPNHLSSDAENVIINESDILELNRNIQDKQNKVNNWTPIYCNNIFNESPGDEVNYLKLSSVLSDEELFSLYINDPTIMHEKYMKILNEIIVKYYKELGFKYVNETNKTIYNI
ncbi:uncharacterized protein LOC126894436 [Daktulosphaira vitifoliae]|uniref:uncharacterized protein LOC126894436 n=1 Tax=Daktulosphaira vitifoliae TaxID=58002 RepID=UPI0021AAD65C|nr:uncharacterized protein LOC126894436 [Daktulosphaira vitifoliae]